MSMRNPTILIIARTEQDCRRRRRRITAALTTAFAGVLLIPSPIDFLLPWLLS